MVECLLAKENVASSNLVSRSNYQAVSGLYDRGGFSFLYELHIVVNVSGGRIYVGRRVYTS